MTKQEIIQDEILFQRACVLWVDRNIGQCVSSLMYDVGRNLEECKRIFDFDYDEAMGWFQRNDWEEPVSEFIRRNADYNDLEMIADEVDSWTDVCEEAGVSVSDWEQLKEQLEQEIEALDDGIEEAEVNEDQTLIDSLEEAKGKLQVKFEEIDAFDDYVKKLDKDEDLREVVWMKVTGDSYERIGRHFNLDPDYTDILEHWVLPERWTANDLEAEGEVVFEFEDMTIWGRTTSGQSISTDYVIRKIVKQLDDDHWIWSAVK